MVAFTVRSWIFALGAPIRKASIYAELQIANLALDSIKLAVVVREAVWGLSWMSS